MNLAWDDPRTRAFVTNVGLITSRGHRGHNIMAAEWTHHISYSPSLIAVSIRPEHATHENVMQSREFDMSLCAADQSVVSSVAGSGIATDKIAVLKALGVEFYEAKKINVLMVKGAVMNAECVVRDVIDAGDHTLFIGEVVEIAASRSSITVANTGASESRSPSRLPTS